MTKQCLKGNYIRRSKRWIFRKDFRGQVTLFQLYMNVLRTLGRNAISLPERVGNQQPGFCHRNVHMEERCL